MTDEATTQTTDENNPPVALVKNHRVIEILGLVEVLDEVDLEEDGVVNNTRWVFDVEAHKEGELVVQLVDYRNEKPATSDIEPSFHFTPLSEGFYNAKVWGTTNCTKLTIHFSSACKFRVDVDVIGSNRR